MIVCRNVLADKTHCTLIENSRRVPQWIFNYFATILCQIPLKFLNGKLIDTRDFHRLRIRNGCVPTGMSQEYGIIGRNFAQQMMRLKTFDHDSRLCIPFVLMPSAAYYPLSWFSFGNSFFYLRDKLFIAFHRHQIKIQFIIANAHNMSVAFDEPGCHRFSLKVNYLRVVSLVIIYLSFGANRYNLSVRDGNSLSSRLLIICRINFSIGDNELSGFFFIGTRDE